MSQVLLFNKPFNVLSQFTDKERTHDPRKTLADFVNAPRFRVAGRLDYDSEGLLVLTNDGALQHHLANPRGKQWKTYWVQVEGEATKALCQQLSSGVDLKDGRSLPARCKILKIPTIWDRNPPIRFRASIPDSWIELSIREGRNRQVRRMTAAAGFPTLRLVRTSIGPFHIGDLQPSESRYEQARALSSDT